jgi:hypothetical protein
MHGISSAACRLLAIENSERIALRQQSSRTEHVPGDQLALLVQLTNKLCSRVAAKLSMADRGNRSQIFWGRQDIMRGAFMNLRRNQTSR